MEAERENQFLEEKRPPTLKNLCILTFIACSAMFLMTLFSIPAIFKSDVQKMEDIGKIKSFSPVLADKLESQMMDTSYKPRLLIKTALDLVLLICSFSGAWMMWNLRRNGFFVYACAEILTNFTGLAMGSINPVSAADSVPESMRGAFIGFYIFVIMLDPLFIYLYWRQLRFMKV